MATVDLDVFATNVDQFFLLINGILVLFMQAGFAFLEAGSVRSKNTTNIIMKNILDVFIGAIMYYSVGYGLAYGEPGNAFIGSNHFFSINVHFNQTEAEHTIAPTSYFAGWFYQFVFAATASTIVSGAMAERTEFTTYMVYCVVLTGFVYPVVSHWTWAESGWLFTGAGTGLSFIDFGGSSTIHALGGTAAFVGAAILGPRIGRFNKDGTFNDIPGHSVTVAALGSFILYVGFLALNGGSGQSISKPGDGLAASFAIMNTILGGSTSAIVTMVLYKATDAIRGQDHYWSLIMTMNGGLAGMVAMGAGCNDYNPWSAAVIGIFAACSFISWHHFMLKIKIDDPIDAVAVHLGGGLTGVLMAPIFVVKGLQLDGKYVGGIIYGAHPIAFKSFGWNLLGTVAIIAWTASICTIMFGAMKKLGFLRVKESVEISGMDKIKHGEPAYPIGGYEEGEHPYGQATKTQQNGNYAVAATVENEVAKATSDDSSPPAVHEAEEQV